MTAQIVELGALRACRLYHWRLAVRASKTRTTYEKALAREPANTYNRTYYENCIKEASARWSLHMGFVQALNQLFDVHSGDTAERDNQGAAT